MSEVQIVGESCVDVYIYGRCPRLSPEAPVPVFVQDRIERVPGMAGNVVANLRALGVTGPFLTQEQVITKTRYVEETRNHPLLRVDDDPPLTAFDWIIDLETPLVLVDYNKGVFYTIKHKEKKIELMTFDDLVAMGEAMEAKMAQMANLPKFLQGAMGGDVGAAAEAPGDAEIEDAPASPAAG